MTYDLDLINDLCRELGLRTRARSANRVAVELEERAVLVFINADREEDSLIGFEDVGWHYHGELMCSDRHGRYVELGYLDILTGLAEGKVLICELWRQGALQERSLVHRDFVDEFRFLQNGEEIRIRRVPSQEG